MNKLLVVVDMQNDFITGSLGTKEAEAIVEKVIDKINRYKKAGDLVVYTRDTHFQDYMQTREGEKLPVAHCIKGTLGWELQEDIEKTRDAGAEIYDKVTFGSTDLAKDVTRLYKENPDLEVELVGLCTDICVVSNALLIKANCPEMEISVDASCCAGVTPETHQSALTTMKMCQVNIIND